MGVMFISSSARTLLVLSPFDSFPTDCETGCACAREETSDETEITKDSNTRYTHSKNTLCTPCAYRAPLALGGVAFPKAKVLTTQSAGKIARFPPLPSQPLARSRVVPVAWNRTRSRRERLGRTVQLPFCLSSRDEGPSGGQKAHERSEGTAQHAAFRNKAATRMHTGHACTQDFAQTTPLHWDRARARARETERERETETERDRERNRKRNMMPVHYLFKVDVLFRSIVPHGDPLCSRAALSTQLRDLFPYCVRSVAASRVPQTSKVQVAKQQITSLSFCPKTRFSDLDDCCKITTFAMTK